MFTLQAEHPILLPDKGYTNTCTTVFKRTRQWYVDSNSNAIGFDHSTNRIDEGWHYVLYKYFKASITPATWQEATINSH